MGQAVFVMSKLVTTAFFPDAEAEFDAPYLIGAMFLGLLQTMIVLRLCVLLNDAIGMLYGIAAFFFCLSLFAMLRVDFRVTQFLNELGIHVGPFGASSAGLKNYWPADEPRPTCPTCGEPLDSQLASCQMCGTAAPTS